MKKGAKICSRCICDTTVQGIEFDKDGVCNLCHEYDERDSNYPLNDHGQRTLEKIIRSLKESGKKKEYDCIIGVSGGTDSTYCLYLAKQWGLRPLAVHFDNGWNSDIAVSNIKKATSKLDVDLYTWVANWEEFKNIQIACLKASIPEADMPTDMAYLSVLYRTALKNNLRYIINGSNFRTEGNQPPAWGYNDGKYIDSVYAEFGAGEKKHHIPFDKLSDLVYYHFVRRINLFKPLYYLDYRKNDVMSLLQREIGWTYYGGHHHENIYTRFIHGYYLPKKFNIDKRIIEYSALIRSGQMTREDALDKIQHLPYPEEMAKADQQYVISKLNLTEEVFVEIMSAEPKMFYDYNTYYPLIIRMRSILEIAYKLHLYPDKVYGKYSY